MSSTQNNASANAPVAPGSVPMKLEVIVVPVSDVARAKGFYTGLGWRLDAEFSSGDDFWILQLTPPASQCSVIFGKGVTNTKPGSIEGLLLAVDDVEKARDELLARGVDVSPVFHDEGGVFVHAGTKGRVAGPDPQGRSYSTWASFRDPDGNTWLLQQITARFPGRLWPADAVRQRDVASLTELLQEAEKGHGAYEATAPKHHWSGWYAAYMIARERGKSPEEASKDAGLHMEKTRR
jgi:catechol 2,3-dioxygenase-like lactoylglutathione lyase family enzyme